MAIAVVVEEAVDTTTIGITATNDGINPTTEAEEAVEAVADTTTTMAGEDTTTATATTTITTDAPEIVSATTTTKTTGNR